KERFEQLRIGPGVDNPDVGPILNQKQFDHVLKMLEIAKQEGEIVSGGKQVTIDNNEAGLYLEPTIVDGVTKESRIAQEEIFGPVVTVFEFKDTEEALSLANSTDYGLVTAIWTQDISRAHYLASRIDAGQVFINNYGAGGEIGRASCRVTVCMWSVVRWY